MCEFRNTFNTCEALLAEAESGKVERCFRTVKDEFFNAIDWSEIKSIEQAQKMYDEFLSRKYLNTKHSAIDMTPKERFMKDIEHITRKTNEQIDESFLHRVQRYVKSDSTISLNTVLYEVPQQFIKKNIIIKYNPENMDELYIYNDENERIHTIKSVDKIANSKYKRQEIVNFYRGEEQEKNV